MASSRQGDVSPRSDRRDRGGNQDFHDRGGGGRADHRDTYIETREREGNDTQLARPPRDSLRRPVSGAAPFVA